MILENGNILLTGIKRSAHQSNVYSEADVPYEVVDNHVDFVSKFMIDHGIKGSDWIRLEAKKYSVRNPYAAKSTADLTLLAPNPTTICQLEVDANHDSIKHAPVKADQECQIRILSFDIECSSSCPNQLPNASVDKVIQIATTISHQRRFSNKPDGSEIKILLALQPTDPIDGAIVESFETEQNLLLSWSELFKAADPDIITGYNVNGFDFPYILKRAHQLKMEKVFSSNLTRVINEPVTRKHDNETFEEMLPRVINGISKGRHIVDMYEYMKNKKFSLPSLRLECVAQHFLNEGKAEDVAPALITKLYAGNSKDRSKLGKYCIQDSVLPIKLMRKLRVIEHIFETANITGVLPKSLLDNNFQRQVLMMIARKASELNYVFPEIEKQVLPHTNAVEKFMILKTLPGFYGAPTGVFKFEDHVIAKIIHGTNICYSTLLRANEEEKHQRKDFMKTVSGISFICSEKRVGIVPSILKDLIEREGVTNAALLEDCNKEKIPTLEERRNAISTAIKNVCQYLTTANSQFPTNKLQVAINYLKKKLISVSSSRLQEVLPRSNVIYAGEDYSLCELTQITCMDEAVKLCKSTCEALNQSIPFTISCRKLYCPFLLLSRQQFAGISMPLDSTHLTQSIESVGFVPLESSIGFTYFPLLKKLIQESIQIMLQESCPSASLIHFTNAVKSLSAKDVNQFELRRKLTAKDLNHGSTSPLPYVRAAQKNKNYFPDGKELGPGDTVSYVIVKPSSKLEPICDRAEPMNYVKDRTDIEVDLKYYKSTEFLTPSVIKLFQTATGKILTEKCFENI